MSARSAAPSDDVASGGLPPDHPGILAMVPGTATGARRFSSAAAALRVVRTMVATQVPIAETTPRFLRSERPRVDPDRHARIRPATRPLPTALQPDRARHQYQ